MGTNGPVRDEGSGPEGLRPVKVDGHTFWRARRGGVERELTSETGIELDGERCRWTVRPPGGSGGFPVESRSREVRRFLGGVLDQMERATRRATARPPVPKPAPAPKPVLPAGAPVPCPLCGGSAWHGCELCDGEGAVTQRRAEEWEELRPH